MPGKIEDRDCKRVILMIFSDDSDMLTIDDDDFSDTVDHLEWSSASDGSASVRKVSCFLQPGKNGSISSETSLIYIR